MVSAITIFHRPEIDTGMARRTEGHGRLVNRNRVKGRREGTLGREGKREIQEDKGGIVGRRKRTNGTRVLSICIFHQSITNAPADISIRSEILNSLRFLFYIRIYHVFFFLLFQFIDYRIYTYITFWVGTTRAFVKGYFRVML